LDAEYGLASVGMIDNLDVVLFVVVGDMDLILLMLFCLLCGIGNTQFDGCMDRRLLRGESWWLWIKIKSLCMVCE
jgi:hypothetical protein